MSYPETGYQCHRCMMRFQLVKEFDSQGETTRCSVPGCGHRFWHSSAERGLAVHCEMLVRDLEATNG